MSGSTFSSLFPQWLGGTAGAAGAQNFTDVAAAMNPALSGQASMANVAPSYSNQVASSINPNWTAPSGGGGNKIGGDLASALKGVNTAATQQNQQSQLRQAQTPNVQSQVGQPSSRNNLSDLLQLLNARTNLYMGATNPQTAQPQAQTQKPSGLLGF